MSIVFFDKKLRTYPHIDVFNHLSYSYHMLTGAILLLLGIAIGYFSKSSVKPLPKKFESKINKVLGRKQASVVDMSITDLGIEHE